MNELPALIKQNICAIVMITITSAAGNSLDFLEWGIPLDLELGAVLSMVILFGWRVFPGILVALYFTASTFLSDGNHHHVDALWIFTVLKCITPYISMSSLKFMGLDNFFTDSRMSFPHLAILIVTTVLITILVLYVITYDIEATDSLDLVNNLSRYISSSIAGSVAFFMVFISMRSAYFKNQIQK